MESRDESILLIGEAGAGKTHFGAQLLKRLIAANGSLKMDGAATNLEPFQAAMECLNEGKAAEHTPTTTYLDSVWPIVDQSGRTAELVWPDYGGEQIKAISATRRIPASWQARVVAVPSWILLIRLQQTRVSEDIFSRPLSDLNSGSHDNHDIQISDQARLVELLQILLYVRGSIQTKALKSPRLCVLLSCWDELKMDGTPAEVLQQRLPMLWSYLANTWDQPLILGLSALGRALTAHDRDAEYTARGPEQFGYVVLSDGTQSTDLTLPIRYLLDDAEPHHDES